MRFLTNWKVNIDKLPAYVEFKQEFREEIDYTLAQMILNYNDDDRLSPEVKAEFSKLVNCIDPNTNLLPVKYSPRYKLGRRYPDCPEPTFPNGQPNPAFNKIYSALISQPRIIKNTIFHYQGWIDLDQKKGHPTLLFALAERNELDLPAYRSYLLDGNFDKIVAEFANYYNVEPEKSAEELAEMTEEDVKEYYATRIDKKDIKWLFNKTIYGGGHSKWVEDIVNGSWSKDGKNICKRRPKEIKNQQRPHPFYQEFKKDTQKVIDNVYLNNEDIAKIVCKDIQGGEEMDWRRKNRVMSYFCGIVENEITVKAYNYLVKNHLIQKGFCDWGLDGITFPAPSPYTDFDFHLNEMNETIRKQTGLPNITFVRKLFEPDELLMPLIQARRELVIANPINQAELPLVDGVAIIEPIVSLIEDNTTQNTDATSVVLTGIIEDDNDGADLIYEVIKDRFKFCGGNIFFKQTHVWVNSKQKVDNHLLHFILAKTQLCKMGGGKTPTPKPYSTNVSGARALREALYARLIVEGEDTTLLQKFITTTRGKLCFLDGVLDLTYVNPETGAKGKFYDWEAKYQDNDDGEERVCINNGNYVDFPYYTPVQIERNFADYFANPNQETIELIKQQIFSNLFGVDCEKALAFFARGVAGNFEDKAWSLYIGNRNCGKGVVDTLCKASLGSYHASINAQNLLCNSSRTLKPEQPEKQMAFAMDIQFARLTFTQELPPPPKNKSIKVNADIIKLLQSGGDPLKGKRNYDIYITEFINQSRLIMMANDCPSLTNEDVLSTCCEFNSTISFKTKEEIDALRARGEDELVLQRYKVGDPLIKDKCKTDEWCNAFIMLMVQYYQHFPVPIVRNSNIMVNDDDDDDDNKADLCKFIITAFEITKAEGDFLKSEAIQEVFEEKLYGDISSKKISLELKAIGLKNGKKGGCRGWFGIKRRPPPPPTDATGEPVN
jgi:hypothetical protein